LIITPGTQGALFLALGATVAVGTKVAVVEPDYFANRKLVKFFDGEVVPIPLNYKDSQSENSPDLDRIEDAFKKGTKVLVFSTPNNPTGLVYSNTTITKIADLAATHDVNYILECYIAVRSILIFVLVMFSLKILLQSWGHQKLNLLADSGLESHLVRQN
jgi:aspartate/methionine/tyrosine aminotransferase